MRISFYICLVLCFFLNCQQPALSINATTIDWSNLNLSTDQIYKIKQLDKDWNSVNHNIRTALANNQRILTVSMADPNISEHAIRNLYIDIILKQQHLKYQALEIFLAKRRMLTRKQLLMLNASLQKKCPR